MKSFWDGFWGGCVFSVAYITGFVLGDLGYIHIKGVTH